jgi:hypothetical protein
MTPWKRTLLGYQVYTGFNLATRKRYLAGLTNPQPFKASPDSLRESGEAQPWTKTAC